MGDASTAPKPSLGLTAAELSAAVGARSSTLTGILDRLERRELVRRQAHPKDRRSYQVVLTAAGGEVAAEVHRAVTTRERTDDFDEFAARCPDLLDKRLLGRHYSSAALASVAARHGWVEPDLRPFRWQAATP